MKKLERRFYNRPTLEVAKELLGKLVVHVDGEKRMACRIVEVEAYIGAIDKAAHSYNNRITERTKVMFGPAGYVYVYLIYGMYHCMNFVTQAEGEAAAVLIRAVEPVEGIGWMFENRYSKPMIDPKKKELLNLTSGPGKLCRALNITKAYNGVDLCGETLFVVEQEDIEPFEMVTTTRINIDYAEEAIHFPWRFYIKDNPYVSKK